MFQNDDCALCNKSKVRQHRKQANASIMICATVFCSFAVRSCLLIPCHFLVLRESQIPTPKQFVSTQPPSFLHDFLMPRKHTL